MVNKPKKPYIHYIQDGLLRSNSNRLVTKSKKGFFNIILVWGATRSGKTTIAAQCAKHIANNLGVPFNEDHIFFDTQELVEEAKKGKQHYVYQLDEAAFELMGEDWHLKAHKNLIKLMFTAAKFNQTFFILIPKLEKLRETIVSDEHTRGLYTYYNQRTFERGFFRGYSNTKVMRIYDNLRNKRYDKAKNVRPNFKGRFSQRFEDFIDNDKYQAKKDIAINKIGKEEKKDSKVELLLLKLINYSKSRGISIKDMNKGIGVNKNWITDFKERVEKFD